MQAYTDAVIAINGAAATGASVLVKTYPGGATATIYSDNGITPTANPLTCDSFGTFSFYAANGLYALTISGNMVQTKTTPPIQLYDFSAGPPVGTVTSVSVVTANGVSGSVATATTTPAITLSLGAITPTSVNGLTVSTTTGIFTLTNAKTLAVTNSLTLSGTDSTIMTFPTTSATIARTDAANTFTGTQTFGAVVGTTWNGNTWATGTGTLSIAASKTLTASNSLTLAGTDATTMTFPPASASIGYLNIPQNSQSAAYTTVAADSGKEIFHPASDATPRTFTIDSNANVAFVIGTAIAFTNRSASAVTISITTDTLTFYPSGATGSRTLAQYGTALAVKTASTEWRITGVGIT